MNYRPEDDKLPQEPQEQSHPTQILPQIPVEKASEPAVGPAPDVTGTPVEEGAGQTAMSAGPSPQPVWGPQTTDQAAWGAQPVEQPAWGAQPVEQPAWDSQSAYPAQSYWASQPPPQPKKSRGWIAILVALLLVVLLGGAAGAFVALRNSSPSVSQSPAQQPSGETGDAQSGGLRITFKSADVRYYKMDFRVDGTLTGGGALADDSGPVSTSTQVSSDVTLQVIERLPSGATRVKMTMSNTRMTVTVNGERQTVPDEIFDGMEMTYKVQPDGTFEIESSNIEGFDSDGANPFGGGTFGPTGGAGSSPFGFNGPAPILPDHPVKPGDSWDKTIETKAPGFTKPLTIKTSNTYERDENTQWGRAMVILTRLNTSIDMSALDASSLEAPSGARYSGTFDVSMAVRFWFVPELGESVKQVLDPSSSLRGTMGITVPSGTASGSENLTIGMDLEFEMTMERQVSAPPSPSGKSTPAISS